MSKELATTPAPAKASVLASMASRLNAEQSKFLATLKATVFKQATDEEMMALCIVANEYHLNPFLKEVYAFPAKGGGIVPIVSVDGWLRIINEHPQMNGLDFQSTYADGGKLESVTCTIWRKDREHPIRVTEYLSECKRPTDPWKMENRMLRHKALIQCARVAFGFSGIYDEDEAERIQGTKQANAREITAPVFTDAVEATPEPAKTVPQSKATPIEQLANLVRASRITEADVLVYIKEIDGNEYEQFADIPEATAAGMVANWDGCLEAMKGAK